ncbi:amidase [Archangium violaceum]|uniref:amidase n=1 Tax=Archangium violaceum TaxID=83451 RepID=UPI0005BDEC28|nr:amidase family protein [Archangium violaceum]
MTDLASLARLDGVALAELCARGELSPAESLDACMARIDALNPLLRAVVTVAQEQPGPARPGPFSGVPFLVKDSTPWPGLRWSMGSRLFAANTAQQQTPYGRRLAESGLVCAGKSATAEFGLLFSTETLLEGVTHNPWDLSRSATGSSGGSAVAVAAGLVPLAHANDGGGSLRVPASACGLFGFKPSRGRTVPAGLGGSDFGDMTSDHCISRSVRDSALFLSITEDRSSGTPVGFVREPLSRPLRIATWTRTVMGTEPEPPVRRAYDEAVALLTGLGHSVEPIVPPGFDSPELGEAFLLVAGAAVAGIVESVDQRRDLPVQRDELEPYSWALADAFLARGADALPRARAAFARAVHAYNEATRGYDVVLTPTLATTPWPLGHLSPVLGREELARRTARAIGYTPLHNIAGCPAMSVPLHFPEDGLPIGTHFAAAPGADALLLGLAYQLEQARPWKDRWPPYSIPVLFQSSSGK